MVVSVVYFPVFSMGTTTACNIPVTRTLFMKLRIICRELSDRCRFISWGFRSAPGLEQPA